MEDNPTRQPSNATRKSRSAKEIQEFIADWLCREMQVDRAEIELDQPVTSFGVDSMKIVAFVVQLEAWLGFRFDENPFQQYRTIAELSAYLAERSGQGH